MIVSLAISVAAWRFLKKTRIERLKKYELVPVVVMVISMAAILAGLVEEKIVGDGGTVLKNESGEGVRNITLYADSPNVLEDEKIELELPERSLSEEEVFVVLDQARDEVLTAILGENGSYDRIVEDIVLREELCGGLVTAGYDIAPGDVIDGDGSIIWENVSENTAVTVDVKLNCGEVSVSESIPLIICRDGLSEEEKVKLSIEDNLREQYTRDPTGAEVVLPEEAEGHSLKWTEKTGIPYKLLFVFVLGIAGVLIYLQYSKEGKAKKEYTRRLQEQYPDMIDSLMLLIAAGMNIHGAWSRVVSRYRKDLSEGGAPVEVYEEMALTLEEIKDGVSEAAAYERFAGRTGLQCYRRFTGLLIRNLKKGGSGMLKQMEEEVTESFEEKKRSARRVGEEAGTKLLMPMMLMLAVVLVILMAPVLMTM